MYIKILLLLCATFFLSFSYAQQLCNVRILFPKNLNAKKITITFFNGEEEKNIPIEKGASSILVTEKTYSKYSKVSIFIDSNTLNVTPRSLYNFFIYSDQSIINLSTITKEGENLFLKPVLSNAVDVGEVAKPLFLCFIKGNEKIQEYVNSPDNKGFNFDTVKVITTPFIYELAAIIKKKF